MAQISQDPSGNPEHPVSHLKFSDPRITATGEQRASVDFRGLETLWFNTGTLCNIECANCYIKSGPLSDRLVYLTPDDIAPYVKQAAELMPRPKQMAFTGGEPFMNPRIIELLEMTLKQGYDVLVLTNAMQPMMRPKIKQELVRLKKGFGDHLTLRVSLDHHSLKRHEDERGEGSWAITLTGLRWLREEGFRIHIAGRQFEDEREEQARQQYAKLFSQHALYIDANNPEQLVLFPEMDEAADTPEITVSCWEITGRKPTELMCSNSRMVIKRKGQSQASIVACTLLPDEPEFELGRTLKEAEATVSLNHRHCSKFCVLGGASCST